MSTYKIPWYISEMYSQYCAQGIYCILILIPLILLISLFLCRVCLISLNEQRQIKHVQDSGLLRLSLHKNEEKQVMILDKQLTYPLCVSVNMQVVTPFVSHAKEISADRTILSNPQLNRALSQLLEYSTVIYLNKAVNFMTQNGVCR